MKVRQLMLMTVLCLLGTGCRLGSNLIQTTMIEPVQFGNNWDEKLQRHRYRQLAEAAFASTRATARAEADDYQQEPFSADERRGFVDGYVDYLEAGGTGQPPPLPPRRYWKPAYQTPQGQQAVQDWFRGYEHGATMADASGYRQLVTIPISDAIASSTIPNYKIPRFHHQQSTKSASEDMPKGQSRPSAKPEDDMPQLMRLSAVPEAEPTLL